MQIDRKRLAIAGLLAIMLAGCGRSGEDVAPAAVDEAEETAPATIAEITEDSDRIDGLFTFFRHRDTGAVHLLVAPEQIGREFIYTAAFRDGVIEAGHFRGLFASNRIISLRRFYDRVEFVAENTEFYFDPDSALSRAADANISPAVMAVAKIVAEEDEGLLLEADELFLSQALRQIKPSPKPDAKPTETFNLGELSGDKSKIVDLRAYPRNVDVLVEYVFENPAPVVAGSDAVTDPRYVSATLQHSFIELPENDFVPRRDDPRMGYFTARRTDQTSASAAPWKDVIQRWHLVRKDPGAELSEPVEPIVWWIENTTPVEFRDAIRNGVLAWNEAFEQAGFKNAIEVRVQPDDAEWDAGDLRYNVLRWTSSPQPPFGGYGPSWTNPRTGQIIGADIMLEYVFVTNRVRQNLLFATALLDDGGSENGLEGAHHCALSNRLQLNNLVGRSVLQSRGATPAEEAELVRQSIYLLALHEVGHTLGLNHNFAASRLLSLEELYDPATTMERGLSASVMDYAPVHLAPPGREQGLYYDVKPGIYDRWAIEYGYSQGLADPAAEAARLEAILARSTQPGHAFGNDADVMRAPGSGVDPAMMFGDYSSDPIGYAEDRLRLLNETTAGLLERYQAEGESYQELYNAYLILTAELSSQANAVTRYVGGVRIDRSLQGQPGARPPFTPVERADQRRAMDFLARRIFAPDAFGVSGELYRRLQIQRRGFDFMGLTEDPKIHARALTIQRAALDHLLNPVVMTRITDTGLYGNEYPLPEMMADLDRAIFEADEAGEINAFRQSLQLEFVHRLIAMLDTASGYDHPSRSQAVYLLQGIRERFAERTAADPATRAHTAAVIFVIDRAFESA
jgi:hypothetical protein